jgi:hypothetical protein
MFKAPSQHHKKIKIKEIEMEPKKRSFESTHLQMTMENMKGLQEKK